MTDYTPQEAVHLLIEEMTHANTAAGEVVCGINGTANDWRGRTLSELDAALGNGVIGTTAFYISTAMSRTAGKRRKEDFVSQLCIVLDDIGTKVEVPSLKPTAKIETSEGNFQYMYVFDAPIENAKQAEAFTKAVYGTNATDGGGAMSVKFVRLPAGVNGKLIDPKDRSKGRNMFSVRMTEFNPGTRYTIEQLITAWGITLNPISRPAPAFEDVYDADDPVAGILRARGIVKEDKGKLLKITCPWVGEHTHGLDDGAAYFLPSNDNHWGGGFVCHHDSCVGRKVRELRKALGLEAEPDNILPWDAKLPEGRFPDGKQSSQGYKRFETFTNLMNLLNAYSINLKFNTASNKVEILSASIPETAGGDDRFFAVLSQCKKNELPTGNLAGFLSTLANQNRYNPVVDWLSSLKRPDYDAIGQFVEKCMPDRNPDTAATTDRAMRLFFHQAVAAADCAEQTPNEEAIAKYEYVPVLQGTQGSNKTTMLTDITPPHLAEYTQTGITLDLGGAGRKDSIIAATMCWLGELGEIDSTFTKTQQSHLKSFLSSEFDVYRKPYGKGTEVYKRATAYFGTVNPGRFLVDPTGNRRFIPIMAGQMVRLRDTDVVLDDVWAQAWAEYLDGAQWWPTVAEEVMFETARMVHNDVDVIVELFHDCYPNYDTAEEANGQWCAASVIVKNITGMLSPKREDVRRLKEAFMQDSVGGLGFKKWKKVGKNERFWIPDGIHVNR